MNSDPDGRLVAEPSDAAYAYAVSDGREIYWPLQDGTVLANALHHVNAHSVNRTNRFRNFAGGAIWIDHVVFTNADVNALATNHRGIYIAGINLGFYLAILDTAFTIFSHPDAIPDIGDPAREQVRFTETSLGFRPTAFESMNEYGAWLGETMPTCPVRRDIAHVLAAMMVAFVLHHEHGHIIAGHIDALREERGLQAFLEFQTAVNQESSLKAGVRNLAELDADRYGLIASLTPLGIQTMMRNYSTVSLSESQWYGLAWFAAALVGALLVLLDGNDFDKPDTWLSHPHALLRARQIMSPERIAELERVGNSGYYEEARKDALSWLESIGNNWPEFAVFALAQRAPPRVNEVIARFNEISESCRGEYFDLCERYRMRQETD